MARQTLIVFDDFYENPDAIRKLALSLEYKSKPKATYPGREAIAPGADWSDVRNALRQYIDQPVDGPCPKDVPFPQGKFRLALAADQDSRRDGVHEDVQPWSGVIYLSRSQDCAGHGAIGFYRHRATGATETSPEWEQEVFGHLKGLSKEEYEDRFWAHMRDMRNWEEIQRVAIAYNRAVLLYAQCFHASIGIFGTEPINGRLTQHFEFYYSEEVLREAAGGG